METPGALGVEREGGGKWGGDAVYSQASRALE